MVGQLVEIFDNYDYPSRDPGRERPPPDPLRHGRAHGSRRRHLSVQRACADPEASADRPRLGALPRRLGKGQEVSLLSSPMEPVLRSQPLRHRAAVAIAHPHARARHRRSAACAPDRASRRPRRTSGAHRRSGRATGPSGSARAMRSRSPELDRVDSAGARCHRARGLRGVTRTHRSHPIRFARAARRACAPRRASAKSTLPPAVQRPPATASWPRLRSPRVGASRAPARRPINRKFP